MSRIIGPGSSRNYDPTPHRPQPFFVGEIMRQYGARGVVALAVAAVVAFLPLALLIWFNVVRLSSVVAAQCRGGVVVRPERWRQQQEEEDEPGDTALLQVTCEVPDIGGWRELLRDDDPVNRGGPVGNSIYVRQERVYLRKAGDFKLPYGLLGRPPVSAWLPEGDYELLVVYEPRRPDSWRGDSASCLPLAAAFDACSLPAKERTVRRIQLPHYDWGATEPIRFEQPSGETHAPTVTDLQPLLESIESAAAWPTPGGYVLSVAEPHVHHTDDHRQCTASLAAPHTVPREWTHDQLAALRWWLPPEATAARGRLDSLISGLGWREFFEGWYCYAAAGVAGLVFTRWGALAILEPYRRGDRFWESLKLCASIFALAAGAWLLLHVLFDGSGCRGPVPFRWR